MTLVAAIAIARMSAECALAANALAANQPTSLVVSLVAEKPSYKSGEEVRLKILVHNASASVLDLVFSGPQNDAEISVRDAKGSLVAPDIGRGGPLPNTSGSVTNGRLQPGETLADTEQALGMPADVQASAEFTQGFVPARWWGYSFAKGGRYTITARRILVTPGVFQSMPAGVFSPWSSPVVISVTP